jgi:hypothetical protein
LALFCKKAKNKKGSKSPKVIIFGPRSLGTQRARNCSLVDLKHISIGPRSITTNVIDLKKKKKYEMQEKLSITREQNILGPTYHNKLQLRNSKKQSAQRSQHVLKFSDGYNMENIFWPSIRKYKKNSNKCNY